MKPEEEPKNGRPIHPIESAAEGECLAPETNTPPSIDNEQSEPWPLWGAEKNPDGTWRIDYTDIQLPAETEPEVGPLSPSRPTAGAPDPGEFNTSARMSIGGKPVYVLPSGHVGFTETAEVFFADLGKRQELFVHGTTVVEVQFDSKTGKAQLERVTPSGLRSRLELLGPLYEYRRRGDSFRLEAGARCSEEAAKGILATRAAKALLPRIRLVVNCPIIVQE